MFERYFVDFLAMATFYKDIFLFLSACYFNHCFSFTTRACASVNILHNSPLPLSLCVVSMFNRITCFYSSILNVNITLSKLGLKYYYFNPFVLKK